MKNKSKNLKKGLSLALTAMVALPTTTSAYAEKVSTPINETNNAVKTESIPYAVLNNKELSNPVSTAKPAKDAMNVYTSFTMSVSSNAGDGSIQNPYNRFEDAIARVAEGGTIYIMDSKGAFLNAQDEYGHVPFLIDKKVTIKPANGAKNAELSVRTGGIILGADVTFENITLSFANKYHDSIFANGHTLNLINVTRASGTRKIDLFAGGLHEVDNPNPIYPSGTKGVINIETNDDFGDDANLSTFGNIYAGSMNGEFKGSAEINITNGGSQKRLDIGAIKASGALEADAGGMFDLNEPPPPKENPDLYPTNGNVDITLNNYQVNINGNTGSDGVTSVTTSTVYPSSIGLEDIDHLTIERGTIKAIYTDFGIGFTSIPNVTLNNEATLDLSQAGDRVQIHNYSGDGIVVLKKEGSLTIDTTISGALELQTDGGFNGKSGLVKLDHTYITTPSAEANITFNPHATQGYTSLTHEQTDTGVEWKVIDDSGISSLPPIIDLSIDEADTKVVKTYAELNPTPVDGVTDYKAVTFPFVSEIDFPPDEEFPYVDLNEYPFEITVNGMKAEYRNDDAGFFIRGYHYFVKDLNLAIFFTPADDGRDNLTIHGFTEDFKVRGIDAGNYEIKVAYAKADGTVAEFTTTLSVTDDFKKDDTKTGTSSITLGDIGDLALGGTVDIPVSIMHEDASNSMEGTTETGTVNLYVNGEKVAKQEVTPSSKSDITFNDVTINTSNHFKLGNNEILITYGGTDTFNGTLQSKGVTVIKATPELTLNSGLQGEYVFDYDGVGKAIGVGIKNKVTATLNGVALSNYVEHIEYRNKSLVDAEFTKEVPYLPGEYETRIVVSEGAEYKQAEIAGPTLKINRVQPKIKVAGSVENGNLTLKAEVSSPSSAITPNGSVKFIINDEEKATVKVVNGVATYTLEGLTGNTRTLTEGSEFVTPKVQAVYVDDLIIDATNNTPLYEDVESDIIEFKVANEWVNVTGVSLEKDVYNLNINGKTTLSAIINDDATNKDVLWSIGDSSIAQISKDGVVEGLSEGETYVTVMTVDGGHEATAIVKVSNTIEQPPLNGGGTGGGTNGTTPDGDGNTGGTGSAGSDSGNNGGAGSDDTDSGNNGGTGTGGSDSGNTGGTGTGGSDSGNTGGTGTGGSDSGNTGGTGTGGSDSGNTGGTGTGGSDSGNGTGSDGSNGSTGDTGSGDSNGDNNGGNGSTDSDTGNNGDTNNGADDPANPENEFKVNLEGLDEELKTKVDSLVTSITAESQKEFTLSLGGDQEDLQHVTDVVVNKDGIFITVGDEQVKVTDKLPTTDLDFTNARVLRLVDNKFLPVKHYVGGEGLRITSGNLEQIIVTSKVNEPFTDVKQDAWHHQYVEEIFNYGFTQGTTATTYSPNNAITRAEFAAMIARAFELTAKDDQVTFEDVKGKWYQDEVQALQEVGIVTGFEDGTFGGDKTITRQEAAKMLLRMLEHAKVDTTTKHSVVFADKDNISDFAKHAVDFLAEKEVFVKGEDVKFNPKNNLTRAEMAKILIRTLKLTDWY